MKHNVVAPSVGESISEVSILKWHKPNGQAVKNGELLLEIESDKATVEIVAEASGVLTQLKPAGERIPVGELIGIIDDAAQAGAAAPRASGGPSISFGGATQGPSASVTPAPVQASNPATAPAAPSDSPATPTFPPRPSSSPAGGGLMSGPGARKAMAEAGIDAGQIPGTGKDGRITKGDVLMRAQAPASAPIQASQPANYTGAATAQTAAATSAPRPAEKHVDRPGDRRVPMTMLRSRIAERLVQAQHTAAILTTFNEADMTAVMALRTKHKDAFKAKHGVSLGFMSFFARASVEALKAVPEVNGSVDGRDSIYHDYVDLGVAVGTDRGLVVPVVRSAHKMGFVEIEKTIAELAVKARDNKLGIADLSGGTFTISNGGVYGSLLSTPILNPPQSGILGMHKIQERPIALNGKVEIRPMMYLALSYDHRLIDGKGAVTFLVALKDLIEHPEKLGLEV